MKCMTLKTWTVIANMNQYRRKLPKNTYELIYFIYIYIYIYFELVFQ